MIVVELRRIDPAQNMHRFYRFNIERDLFGGFLLLKQWGRIGTAGRTVAEHYDSELPALTAMKTKAAQKKSRGYAELAEPLLAGSATNKK
jgi:predicted DNA-binding WGR domain protein